jgi:tetratricopeptide (TPR) repeat protein
MAIDAMTETEAVEFLLSCSQLRSPDGDAQGADVLVNTLGCLPLAIEQAGGYIRSRGISVARYMTLFEANKSDVLKEGLASSHKIYYERTVSSTWKISFDEVDKRDVLASEILRLMAFLDAAKIPKELFEVGHGKLSSDWNLSTATPKNIDDSVGCLLSFSLVRPIEGDNLSIHLLVQQVMREQLVSNEAVVFGAASRLVQLKFPNGSASGDFRQCLKYVSHAQICAKYAKEYGAYSEDIFWLTRSLGAFSTRNGQYREAISSLEQCLALAERQFGVDHLECARPICNIGTVLYLQGKIDQAIPYLEHALKIHNRESGQNSLNSTCAMEVLGMCKNTQGKFDEAITLYKTVLCVYNQNGGENTGDSARVMTSLGDVSRMVGKYSDAVSYFEKALSIFNQVFGKDEINSAYTINCLGFVHAALKEYDEAITLFQRALNLFEEEFGVDHINSTHSLQGLAHCYRGLCQLDEALEYQSRCYEIRVNCLGAGHPDTIWAKTVLEKWQSEDAALRTVPPTTEGNGERNSGVKKTRKRSFLQYIINFLFF